jgi:hypothetical protein
MHCPSQSRSVGSEHPQRPRKHCSLPAHAFPQAPQFASSKRVFVHTPEQSVPPFGQVQTPFWHDFPPVQTLPQAPQLLSSDWVLTHASPQSVVPSGQVQTRSWQVCPPLQTMPQPPQLLLSCRRSAHVWPSQQAWLESSQQSLPHATSPSIVSQHRPASLQNPVPCRQTLPG